MSRVGWEGLALVVVAVFLGNAGAVTSAQPRVQEPEGARLYRTYCASCHGTAGQGNGPVAGVLRRAPANLTVIAANNGGVFPSARIHRIIDGRDVESHGVPEMPVWGDAFKRTTDGTDEAVRTRIAALVQYLESLQQRNAQQH
jgi:mono/diheme cytochrome c family protein